MVKSREIKSIDFRYPRIGANTAINSGYPGKWEA